MEFSKQRRSLLSSQARIQVPWVKVTIGTFTFGIFTRTTSGQKTDQGFYTKYNIQYPNYVKSLGITKINGQINQYVLNINYPVTADDDPNFFEKVFSSVSQTRRIVFSYGDASMPTYIYKEEEAIITSVNQSFNFGSSGSSSAVISYTINAISAAALKTAGCCNFLATGVPEKPSDKIKSIFRNRSYGLQDVFTGMQAAQLDKFIDGSDQPVILDTKLNISVLDYIVYLASCMIPVGSVTNTITPDIYILTIHDDASTDVATGENNIYGGPYFKVTRTSYKTEQSDAYELDLGYNTATIVTNFGIQNNENYSIYYDYQGKLAPDNYVRRINSDGKWEDVFAPLASSKNKDFETNPNNLTW